MNTSRLYHAVIFLLLSALSTTVWSLDVPRGKVLKVSGDVALINESGDSRKVNSVDQPVQENDTIVTGENASIIVRFNDGSLSVLDEKSRLRVEKTSWFSYLGGKVYFTFKRVFGSDQRRVKTPSATIGVRGTTFIIDALPDGAGETVSLKDGLVNIESNGPAFQIHRKQPVTEFDMFRQQQMQARQQMLDEFEQYKQQSAKEFVEYRRQFMLKPNRTIRLSGYRIDETEISDQVKADFESFEMEAGDRLRQFHSK
jgi:hypothetical protein